MKKFVFGMLMFTFIGIILFGGNLIYAGLELPIPTDGTARTPVWLGALFLIAGTVALTISGGVAIENCK